MARRKRDDGILNVVAGLPWWVGVSLAVLAYISVRFILPAMWANSSPALKRCEHGIAACSMAVSFSVLGGSCNFIFQKLRSPQFGRYANRDSQLTNFGVIQTSGSDTVLNCKPVHSEVWIKRFP